MRAVKTSTPAAPTTADTPTLRERLRRGRTWLRLAGVLAFGVIVLVIVQGATGGPGRNLAADNPAPAGAQAVVTVLGDHGVEVTAARSLPTALAAASARPSTLAVHDEAGILTGEQIAELAASTDHLVVIAPTFDVLRELAPGVRFAGAASGPLEAPNCAVNAATNASELSDGQRLLTVDELAADAGWTGCFPDDAGGGTGTSAFALAHNDSVAIAGGAAITVVPASVAFANETITEAGNAALAIGLLGEHEQLVWYLPGPGDADTAADTVIGSVFPGWGGPALALAVLVTIAAGVWRGRRFGALVAEDLPVHVPVGETSEGRARLYARSRTHTHALDQLRIAALRRLTRQLRIPAAADVSEIIDVIARTSTLDAATVRHVLVDGEPATDRELVDLAERLAELEHSVARSIRPDSTDTPNERHP